MRDYLFDKFTMRSIWHFTDKRNIPKIKEKGAIFCTAVLDIKKNNIITGGNKLSLRLDEEKIVHQCVRGNDSSIIIESKRLNQFVHCAFISNHQMEWKIRNREINPLDIAWLEINTEILDVPGVLYSKGVANATNAIIEDADEVINDNSRRIPWVNYLFDDTLKNRYPTTFHGYCRSEILIPEKIPIDYIINGL